MISQIIRELYIYSVIVKFMIVLYDKLHNWNIATILILSLL